MRLWARVFAVLAAGLSTLALAACVQDGGHCLNPQPDLPCGASDSSQGMGGSGPSVPTKGGSAGSGIDLGTPPVVGAGGAAAGANPPSGDASVPSEPAAGASGEAGTSGESGSAGEFGSAGSLGTDAGSRGVLD